MPASARLALGRTRPLRNAEKHLKAVEAWAAAFAGIFPPPGDGHRPCAHWHLPVDQRLVAPPTAKPAHQARVLKAMLEAATSLALARPAARSGERVYVVTHWPDMFMAEVGVFLDPDYGRSFESRTGPYQTWTLLDPRERSLLGHLGLSLPAGWVEHGYHQHMEDPDDEEDGKVRVFENEVWVIREPFDET